MPGLFRVCAAPPTAWPGFSGPAEATAHSHDHRSYGGSNVGDAHSYFWRPLWRNQPEKTLLKLP